jgi:hypothetical protein
VRPDLDRYDQIHDVGCKAIISGADILAKTLTEYDRGVIKGHKQDLKKGVLCRSADFGEKELLMAQENFRNGMIKNYIDQKKYFDSKRPIIE